jgi:hypothetical protein
MYYWDNETQTVKTCENIDDNERKFTIKIYKSDDIIETLKDVKRIVVDVDKTNGTTIVDMLDPDYTELKERIENLEKGFLRKLFERIFKK